MAAETTTASTAALLAPWLDHANQCMNGHVSDLAGPRDLDVGLWMSWNLAPRVDGLDEWIFTLETIELLDLYLRVDYVAGWTFVLERMEVPLYVGLLEKLPGKVYLKHKIDWDLLDPAVRLARAEQLVLAIPDELHTPLFRAVRDEMMVRWGRERRPEDRVRVSLALDIQSLALHGQVVDNGEDGGGDGDDDEDNGDDDDDDDDDDEDDAGDSLTRALEDLVELAKLAQDPSRRALLEALERARHGVAATPRSIGMTRPSEVFALYGFEVFTGDTPLTDTLLTSMCAVTRCGLPLMEMSIDRFAGARDELTLTTLVTSLRSLFLSQPHAHPMTLTIFANLEPSIFQAICSVVAATPSMYEVELAAPRAPSSDKYWSWLAYALLRSDVRPRCIKSVSVGALHLKRRDVDEIDRVLRASDPLAALSVAVSDASLLQRDPEVVDVRPQTASVARTRTINTQQGDVTLEVIPIDETACLELSVVDDAVSAAHIGVLYPGAGVCYVRRDEIVARRRIPSLSSPPPHEPALRWLELKLGHETSVDALLSLVQRVGPSAQCLLLFASNRIELPDSFMRGVLAACPQLEQLDLTYVAVESYAWLTHNETARMPMLKLRHVECLDPQGFTPLAAALSDTTHGLGNTLRELAITDYVDELAPSWPGFVDMLTTNRRLERLLFRTHYDENNEEVEVLARQLYRHNGELLHVQDEPFPMRSRLALLSVFTRRRDMAELKPHTFALVFALAAPNKRRVCGFMHKGVPSQA